MNLENQKLSGVDQVTVTDALNASLLKLIIKLTGETVVPSSNDLIVYVDKNPKGSQTTERKKYVFNLNSPLRYLNNTTDKFVMDIFVENNDVKVKTIVNRIESTVEEVDYSSICLFEGINYIYTNYDNSVLELIYPKNDDFNKAFLNALMYIDRLKLIEAYDLDKLYFKEAFTKTEDKLNLEVNNINIDCITSKNDKFSLDSDGNLIVNSISTIKNPEKNMSIIDMIYPIGSIYLSVNDADPEYLFGGKWKKIEGKFLLGSATNFILGTTGGEEKHLLTASESGLRAHNHLVGRDNDAGYGGDNGSIHANGNYTDSTVGSNWRLYTSSVNAQSAQNAHNNMPPYLVVSMYQRIKDEV